MRAFARISIKGGNMLKFIIKFIRSMQKEQKALLLFVIISMIVCNVLVINITNQYYYNKSAVSSIELLDRKVTVYYSDITDIDKIINELNENDKILKITLWAMVNSKTVISEIKGYDYESQPLLFGKHFEGKDGTIQLHEYETNGKIDLFNEEVQVKLGSIQFKTTGDVMLQTTDYTISNNDFIELGKEKVFDGDFSINYQYDSSCDKQDTDKINSNLDSIKQSSDIFYTMNDYDIDMSKFIESSQTIILGLVMAIINYMFVYLFLIKNRMKNYNILKLLGFGNLKILLTMLSEMFILFVISFGISTVGYIVYLKLTTGYNAYIMSVSKYSFVLMLILNIVIYIITVRKMIKQSPFEFYKQVD